MGDFLRMEEQILNEINDLSSPRVIEHFVGQRNVVEKVRVALDASHYDGARMPHTLCTGSAGLGKTQLSHIIAREMGSELKEQLAQNLTTPGELHGFLMQATEKDVLLIDEIHELQPQLQTALYRVMENGFIFLITKISKKSHCLKLPNMTIVGATTDAHCLLKPLRDRFKLELQFDFYSQQELSFLLEQRAKHLGWNVEERLFSLIAKRGKGVPRIALRLLESVRRTARSENSDVITVRHFEKTCHLEGLDRLGLGPDERRYLSILHEHNCPVRLNILAIRMGLHPRTISQVVEPYLVRAGLVAKDDKGRILTAKGLDHIRNSQTEGD